VVSLLEMWIDWSNGTGEVAVPEQGTGNQSTAAPVTVVDAAAVSTTTVRVTIDSTVVDKVAPPEPAPAMVIRIPTRTG
jgi:hypothetical protein